MWKLSGKVLLTSTSKRGPGEMFSTSSCNSISCCSSEKTSDRLSSWSLSGLVSMDSFRTSIRGPLAEYGITVSSVASSSLTDIERPPMSVALVDESSTSMSHALCFLLAFRSISSPSMVCRLIEPSGFKVELSTSLRVACSLSPGIASTSMADLRWGEEAGATTGLDRASAMAESSSESKESTEDSGSAQSISSASWLSPAPLSAASESCREAGSSDSSSGTSKPGGGGGGESGPDGGGEGASKPGGGEGASPGSSSGSPEISLSSSSIKPGGGGGGEGACSPSESSSSSSSKPGGGGGGGGRGNPEGGGGGSSDMALTPRWVVADVAWIGITITCRTPSRWQGVTNG